MDIFDILLDILLKPPQPFIGLFLWLSMLTNSLSPSFNRVFQEYERLIDNMEHDRNFCQTVSKTSYLIMMNIYGRPSELIIRRSFCNYHFTFSIYIHYGVPTTFVNSLSLTLTIPYLFK